MIFLFLVNNLEKSLSKNDCEQLKFNAAQFASFRKITVLLYADDTIVLADSVKLKSILLQRWEVTSERKENKSYEF